MSKESSQISYADFEKVEMRVGKIIQVEDFPKARKPAYKLWIDFGDFGIKKSSVQCTQLYKREELLGRQVVAVCNFPPRQIADFMSEVLVLGASLELDKIVLLQPEQEVPLGERIF